MCNPFCHPERSEGPQRISKATTFRYDPEPILGGQAQGEKITPKSNRL